ncbi:MAG TPA: HIT family protein [Saprospiraceae bacterium]|nr:HIT family protein [Saprospiraceae bacterium]
MASIFTKIINGDIPSYKVAEDHQFYAFLDIHPLAAGHTLVIPKEETDYIFDLNPEMLADLMQFAQKVAKGMDQVISCERIGVAVIGLEVPHAHIHLVPINGVYDIDFGKPRVELSQTEFQEIAGKIAKAI